MSRSSLFRTMAVMVLVALMGFSAAFLTPLKASLLPADLTLPTFVLDTSAWNLRLANAGDTDTRLASTSQRSTSHDKQGTRNMKRYSAINFGPIDAVEEKVDELDEKANDYWQDVWDQFNCNGDAVDPNCDPGAPEFPDKVLNYWKNHPGSRPSSFGAEPVEGSHKDDGDPVTSADTVQQTKSPNWSVSMGGPVTGSPSIAADGTIYVTSQTGTLKSVTPGGSTNWSYSSGALVQSSPLVGPDTNIYFGSHDGRLHKVNDAGVRQWTHEVGGYVIASPVMGADSTIYVGSSNGTFEAIDPTGTQQWSINLGDTITSTAAVASDSTIYVGTWGNEIVALNAGGTVKWTYGTDGPVKSSPAIGADGTVYVGSSDQYLYAINPDGSLKWRSQTGGSLTGGVAIGADSTVYVGSWDHNLYAFQPNGTQKWTFETGNRITATPTVGDTGVVYVGSGDGSVYGVKTDGEGLWKVNTGSPVSSSVAVGSAYVGSGDGNLYSLDVSASGLANSPWPRFRKNNRGDGSGVAGQGVTPTITIQSPIAGADTNVSPISVAGSASNADAGDSVELRVNSGVQDSVSVDGAGNWSSPSVSLSGGTNTLTAILYDTSTGGVVNDSASITVQYDTIAPAIDTALVQVGDGVDTYGYANLSGDSILRAEKDITLSVPVASADTVTAFYNRDGTPPLTSDTPLSLSIATAGATYDTWQATVPSTELTFGDTLGFLVRASDRATNADSDARGGTGYRVRIDRPAYFGPTWYVNDNDTTGDVYTSNAGSDTTGNGSSSFPFGSISQAMTQVSAGDTVKIDAGTYVDTITINTNDLAFVGVDSGATVLTSNDSGSSNNIGFSADSQSGISIRDLRITDMYHAIEFNATTRSRVEHVRVDQPGNQAVRFTSGSDTTVINDVTVTDGPSMAFNIDGDSTTIKHSVARNNGGNGFRMVNSKNGMIRNNRSINNGFKGFVISNTVKSELRNNVSRDNSSQSGFQLDNGSDTNVLVNNLSVNNGDDGFSIAGSGNTIKLNQMKNNANYGVVVDNGNFNRITRNNLLTNGINNAAGETIVRNWWNTTDETTIASKIDVSVDSAIPYRLGEIDTGVGADTLAPASPVADTAIAGNQSIEVRWQPIPNTDGDFTEYRVYRDTSLTSDWKQNGTVVATNNTVNDTNFVDSGLVNGQSYYYRVTAVDNHTPENESYFSDTVTAVPTAGPVGFDTSSLIAYNPTGDTLFNSANELDGGFAIDFADSHFFRVRAQNADTVTLFYNRDGAVPTTADTSFQAVSQAGVTYDTWTVSLWSFGSFDEFAIGDTINFMLRATKATTGETTIIDNAGIGYQYHVSAPSPVFDTSTMTLTDSFDTISGGSQFDGTRQLSTTVDTHTITMQIAHADTVISYVRSGSVATPADTVVNWSRIQTGTTYDTWQAKPGDADISFGSSGETASLIVEARQADGDTKLIDRGGAGYNYQLVDDHFDTSSLYVSNGSDTLYYSQLLGGNTLLADTHLFSIRVKNADTVVGFSTDGGGDARNDTTPSALTKVGTGVEYDTWQASSNQREDIGETVAFIFQATEATPGTNSDTEILDPGGIGFNYQVVDIPNFDTASIGVTDGGDTLFNAFDQLDGSQALSAGDTNTAFVRVDHADSVWAHYTLNGDTPARADTKIIWTRSDTSPSGDTWVDPISPDPLIVGDTPTFILVAKNPAGDTTLVDRGGAGYSWQLVAPAPQLDTSTLRVGDGTDTLTRASLNGSNNLGDTFDHTVHVQAPSSDTVNLYYRRDGTTPTTADTRIPLTNTAGDTYEGVLPDTDITGGDTVNFILEGINSAGDTVIEDSGGLGYEYWVYSYDGPTWYVNDNSTANDQFTSATGNDTSGIGSANDPFRTIGKAMTTVSAGDTVRVDAGTYPEQVTVDTNGISIVGVDSSPTGTVLDLGDTTSGNVGIFVDIGLSDVRISNLRIQKYYRGIEWEEVNLSRIENVTTQQMGQHGLYLRDGLGRSDTNVLKNIVSRNNQNAGIQLKGYHNGQVSNNVTRNNNRGIVLENSTGNLVSNNLADSNVSQGFYFWSGSDNNTIKQNQSLSNGGSGFFGDNSNGHRIVNNLIRGNGSYGLEFNASANSVIEANQVSKNTDYQVYLSSTTSADSFSKNNFQASATNPDSVVFVNDLVSDTFDFKRNYWNTTDESVIEQGIVGGAGETVAYRPYRLGQVDTGVGADTVAPERPVADTAIPRISNRVEIRWQEVTLDADGSSLDFAAYRIYRDTDPNQTDWKQNSSLVATVNSPGDTDYIDTGLTTGDTYYYRVTAVDNPVGLENESFFSDTMTATAKFWDTGVVQLPAKNTGGAVADHPNADTTYILGGQISGAASDTVWAYSDTTGWTISTKPGPMISPRKQHSAAFTPGGDTLFVVGGRDGGINLTGVRGYDFRSDTWVTYTNLPSSFKKGEAEVVGDTLYVIGGFQDGSNYSDTVWSYDLKQGSNGSWDTNAVAPLSNGRDDFESVVANGGIYVFGGKDSVSGFLSVEFYDPAINSWSAKQSMPSAHQLHAGVKLNGKIYAIAGKVSGTIGDTVSVYDISSDSWNTGAPIPGSGRQSLMAGVSGNKIIVAGGNDGAAVLDTVNRARP